MTGNKNYIHSKIEQKCKYCGSSLRRLKNETEKDKERNIHSTCLKRKNEEEHIIIEKKKIKSYFTFD